MKTETEWQARALEVARTIADRGEPSSEEADIILNFAREYAAEALAEVERLKDDNAVCRDAIEGAYLLAEDWARDDSNGSDMDQGAARATLRCLNEAVGKAAPLLLKERLEGQRLYGLRWKELKQEIADLRAQLAASGPVKVRQLLHDFADYLHRLPDENGWEVGPMQVKFTNGAVSSGPLWVGQDDTRRWADQFLAQLAAPPKENG